MHNGSIVRIYGAFPEFTFWTAENVIVTLSVADAVGNSASGLAQGNAFQACVRLVGIMSLPCDIAPRRPAGTLGAGVRSLECAL